MSRFWTRRSRSERGTPPASAPVVISAAAQQASTSYQAARRANTWGSVWRIVVFSAPLIGLALLIPVVTAGWKDAIEYCVVAGLSGLVAYGELLSRYRDDPRRLFGAGSTPAYILVNIGGGIAAVVIIRYTGALKDAHPLRLYEILLASFGAIAFFRTSLFTARVGSTDIGIGPSAVLQSLLGAADRMIDRDQAEGRAEDVAGIMRAVDFAKAQVALPTFCFILVQNLTAEDQKAVAEQVKDLAAATNVSDDAKAIILGVYLIRLVGADVLERSVRALGSNITKTPAPSGSASGGLGPATQAPPPPSSAAQSPSVQTPSGTNTLPTSTSDTPPSSSAPEPAHPASSKPP